jgi:hypothetical protein
MERLKDATTCKEETQQDVTNLEELACHFCLLIIIVRTYKSHGEPG